MILGKFVLVIVVIIVIAWALGALIRDRTRRR
jgi:septation ring formation regulator EzrA